MPRNIVIPPLPANLLEPSPNDTVVTDAVSLAGLLAWARRNSGQISLRLKGNIRFEDGSARDLQGDLLPPIYPLQSVTLWADEAAGGATLDARGLGRLLLLADGTTVAGRHMGGTLLLQNIHLTGGRVNANAGGCVYVSDGFFVMRGGSISNCSAVGAGGGLFLGGGDALITDALFNGCSANQGPTGWAAGGGLALQLGNVTLVNTRFVRNRASSMGRPISGGAAFGGGIAVYGDGGGISLTAAGISFLDCRASSNVSQVFGGGIGMNGGVTTLFDASFMGCAARATGLSTAAAGGSIGNPHMGTLFLYNATLVNSSASVAAPICHDPQKTGSCAEGAAISTNPTDPRGHQGVHGALVTIRQSCDDNVGEGATAATTGLIQVTHACPPACVVACLQAGSLDCLRDG